MTGHSWFVAVAMAAAMSGAAVRADEPPLLARTKIPMVRGQVEVHHAIRGAAVLLEQPACQRLFEEFTDDHGRTLRENLDAAARRPIDWLRVLWFVDASADAPCLRGGLYAYTTPHSRVVYVCTRRFSQVAGRGGEFVIIHELLHTLGLGESGRNPSSQEISRRVARRCR